MHILLVEDDDSIAEPLVTGLARDGFVRDASVDTARPRASTARRGRRLRAARPRASPTATAPIVCRALRARSIVPIIVVTARGDEVDRVVLLELGADDYVVKPFGFRELVARIRAVVAPRRSRATDAAPTPAAIGGLTIDQRSSPRHGRRQRSRRSRPRSSTCSRSSRATRARSTGATRSSSRSGTRTGTDRRRRSTSTSPHCARSSATRAGSRRSAASASGSSHRRSIPTPDK